MFFGLGESADEFKFCLEVPGGSLVIDCGEGEGLGDDRKLAALAEILMGKLVGLKIKRLVHLHKLLWGW